MVCILSFRLKNSENNGEVPTQISIHTRISNLETNKELHRTRWYIKIAMENV